MNQVVHSRGGLPPYHLIQEDRVKPANCFYLNGTLEEGFHLDFGHPLSGGRAALIVGERTFVLRDNKSGCVYEVRGGRGFVRRATLGEMTTTGGKKFPLISKADDASRKKLVFVDFSMGPGFKLAPDLEPLWAGVSGVGEVGRVVVQDSTDALVEMAEGDTLYVFYESGEVTKVLYEDLGTKTSGIRLAAEDALNLRIDHASELLKQTATVNDFVARAKAEDHALHLFAAMLRMAKLFPPKFGKKIIHAIDSLAAGGCVFRPAVRKHFKTALAILGDRTIYSWLADETVGEVVGSEIVFVEPPRKCDGRLHGLIGEAMSGLGTWERAYDAIAAAAAQSNLRPGVQKRFMLQCPTEKSVLSDKVARLPLATAVQTTVTSSPLGVGDEPLSPQKKLELATRVAVNRSIRHEQQPAKGAGNGSSQKGNKKSKK